MTATTEKDVVTASGVERTEMADESKFTVPAPTRTCLLTVAEREVFDPGTFTAKLKAAGFQFDSDFCPIKIKPPWTAVPQGNGDVLYSQWDGISVTS